MKVMCNSPVPKFYGHTSGRVHLHIRGLWFWMDAMDRDWNPGKCKHLLGKRIEINVEDVLPAQARETLKRLMGNESY